MTTAYNQWTQFESFPHFLDEVESITQLDETHNHWKVKIGGFEREFDTEITEQHPDERVAWKSVGGDTAHAGVVTFHRLDESQTRVTVQIDWEPGDLLEKAGALVHAPQHAVKKDLRNFKEFIEGRGGETGSWRGDVDAGTGAVSDSDAGSTGTAAYGGTTGTTVSGLPGAGGEPLRG
ncbi:SRPBCC family protein [Microbacterium sp. 4R-513]|uniref:SRPBCC family protein n=1 Tax=Microbacterium sp. 4R-513 TaxID=2567934 RepID=UPI001F493DDD|nr:SRPBCC family protein [Microbacterium sp. 4R-513]